MTPEEALAVLQDLTYKPGWTVHAHTVLGGSVVVRIGRREPDSCAPEQIIDVTMTDSLAPEALAGMVDADLLGWAYGLVARRELHEVEEWLRWRGTPVRSPHPDRVPGLLGAGFSTPL